MVSASFFRRLRGSRRVRIIVSAVLIGIFCGVTKLGLPLEDGIIAARTALRHNVADKEIVVVTIDDETLNELHSDDVSRENDAQVLHNLFAAGASRVIFDRSYHFRENAEQDRLLADTLLQYPNNVFMGAMNAEDDPPDGDASLLPAPIFRERVKVVSLVGFKHPFKLSVSFPFKTKTEQGDVPGMAALLANLEELPNGIFRPDYSIDVNTIPRLRYIDALRGRMADDLLVGRDVIIAPTAVNFHDFHEMPTQGYVPGVYFQVVAAQTLKRGIPLDLGWMPAFLLVLALIISGIGRGRSVDRYRIIGFVAVLLIAPFILQSYQIEAEIVPALLTGGIAIFRARALDRVEKASETNPISGLPTAQALKSVEHSPGMLIAVKIRNYGAITGSFAQSIEGQLAAEIVRRIRISEPGVTVYHENDMYLWVSQLPSRTEVFENLEGLHQIVQNGIRINGVDVDLSFNSGIDSEIEKPVSTRVSNAMQAIEEAVRTDELICHYDSVKHEGRWEVSLLSSLDRAIDNGEVWVAYQPKLDLKSGAIKGAEALVRWTHPERGPISPEQFIGLAEEHHRIERITRFVLNDAVRTTAALLDQGCDFAVSVNISAQLLRSMSLPSMIWEALDSNGVGPEHLILEITETDRLDRSSKTHEMIEYLVGSGLQLSIDDFGTGNATLDYLRYLPAIEIKIDKSFVQGMEADPKDLLLVRSIIAMAHSLDRRVVAEGVETETVLNKLREMNCDQIQGYYVSRPVRFAELLSILEIPPTNQEWLKTS